jgi:hypothetical protein
MLEDLLFEINCAEEIGYYKLADILDKKLIKVASKDYKQVRRNLFKQLNKINTASAISFSPSQKAFIIQASADITNKDKNIIKDLASPFPVKFKYASNISKKDLVNLLINDLDDEDENEDEDYEDYEDDVEDFDDVDDEDGADSEEYALENFDLSDLLSKPEKSGEEMELDLYDEDKDEPTEEDLKRTQEFPADDIDELEELVWMLKARKHLEDLGHLPKDTKKDA